MEKEDLLAFDKIFQEKGGEISYFTNSLGRECVRYKLGNDFYETLMPLTYTYFNEIKKFFKLEGTVWFNWDFLNGFTLHANDSSFFKKKNNNKYLI